MYGTVARDQTATGIKDQDRFYAQDDIIAYYNETWLDYRLLWFSGDSMSIHFGYYDEETRRHAAALLRMNAVLADLAHIGPGQRVLDAGCGLGESSFWLAEQRGADVVGVNITSRQVAEAQQRALARGLADRVSFEEADYTQTPFPSASFDVVWSLESLCHACDKAAFYREAARLLRPGGRLVVAEYIRSARPLRVAGEALLHTWLDGWAIPDLDTVAEHLGHAARAGLIDVAVTDISEHTRPSLQRLYRLARKLYPFATMTHRSGLRSARQHGNVIGALRQFEALEQGLWLYGLLVAKRPGAA